LYRKADLRHESRHKQCCEALFQVYRIEFSRSALDMDSSVSPNYGNQE